NAPLIRRRFDRDPAAVALDDFLADREPNSGAGVLLSGVQALEDHEDTVGVLGVDPDSVVPDGDSPPRADALRRNADADGYLVTELERIADEVLKKLCELSR